MRYRKPAVSIRFKIPFGPWPIPLLGILCCILLLVNTTKGTAIRFVIWVGVGHLIYFFYSFRHSNAQRQYKRHSLRRPNARPRRDVFVVPNAREKISGLEVDAEDIEITRL